MVPPTTRVTKKLTGCYLRARESYAVSPCVRRHGKLEFMRILVIEDEAKLATHLSRALACEGHEARVVHDGRVALLEARDGNYNLLVLDVELPRMDGFEILKQLRSCGVATRILMLTARSENQDKIVGLTGGADDYLTKPFAFQELLARLRSLTRRGSTPIAEDHLVVGDLVMDTRAREVTREGKNIDLTPREYALLEYLMRHPGQALSRTMILDRVWEYGFDSFANVVDSTILRLRKAVDDGFETPLIQTVRGVGYRIKA